MRIPVITLWAVTCVMTCVVTEKEEGVHRSTHLPLLLCFIVPSEIIDYSVSHPASPVRSEDGS